MRIRKLCHDVVEFGSHLTRHDPLGRLSVDGVVRDAVRSRVILQQGIGVPVDKFAYPYGDQDQTIQHLIGACGYVFGLSSRPGPSKVNDPLFALPRIEITGSDSLTEFISKLDIN